MKRIIAFFAIVLLMAATSAGVVSLQKDTRLPEVCTAPAGNLSRRFFDADSALRATHDNAIRR